MEVVVLVVKCELLSLFVGECRLSLQGICIDNNIPKVVQNTSRNCCYKINMNIHTKNRLGALLDKNLHYLKPTHPYNCTSVQICILLVSQVCSGRQTDLTSRWIRQTGRRDIYLST